MRTDVPLAALALAGVLALLALAQLTEPDVAPLAGAREGARIAVEARVLAAHEGARATFVTLHDGAHRMDGFAPREARLLPGDWVRAVGVVSRDGGALVLSIDRATVLARAPGAPLPPGTLAREPDAWDGARVAVVGELRAGALVGGDARVKVEGERAPEPRGAWVATGVFRYDASEAAYVLRVESWTRP